MVNCWNLEGQTRFKAILHARRGAPSNAKDSVGEGKKTMKDVPTFLPNCTDMDGQKNARVRASILFPKISSFTELGSLRKKVGNRNFDS